ncbi:hypothetical protein C8J57DRAFT_1729247 [Mycena rebaudengoi]|nr:hypothetical protein C8J57DRAFT_1729247 [Mycena rebaudengoi]
MMGGSALCGGAGKRGVSGVGVSIPFSPLTVVEDAVVLARLSSRVESFIARSPRWSEAQGCAVAKEVYIHTTIAQASMWAWGFDHGGEWNAGSGGGAVGKHVSLRASSVVANRAGEDEDGHGEDAQEEARGCAPPVRIAAFIFTPSRTIASSSEGVLPRCADDGGVTSFSRTPSAFTSTDPSAFDDEEQDVVSEIFAGVPHAGLSSRGLPWVEVVGFQMTTFRKRHCRLLELPPVLFLLASPRLLDLFSDY